MVEHVKPDEVPEKVKALFESLNNSDGQKGWQKYPVTKHGFADTRLSLCKSFNENRPGDGFVFVVHSHAFDISFVFTPEGGFRKSDSSHYCFRACWCFEQGEIGILGMVVGKVIVGVEPETMTEDFEVFGDQFVYCSQHRRVHKTGWCTVGPEDKVALGVSTQEEGVNKCRHLGLKLVGE